MAFSFKIEGDKLIILDDALVYDSYDVGLLSYDEKPEKGKEIVAIMNQIEAKEDEIGELEGERQELEDSLNDIISDF